MLRRVLVLSTMAVVNGLLGSSPMRSLLRSSHGLSSLSTPSGARGFSKSRSKVARQRRRGIKQTGLLQAAMVAEGADVRVRFAPSPTGSLHVGGARTALFNWLKARQTGGKFVVRIEDTDQARSTRESEESMLADLRWLGLDWDEGPGVDGDYGPYRQSERGDIYKKYAQKLLDSGAAYPCFCTEEELEAKRAAAEEAGEAVMYDGAWRDADPEVVAEKLAAGEPHTVRFRVEPGAKVSIDDTVRGKVTWDAEKTVGDFILLRSSGVPVYNFCVAVDDATMKITHVIRAEEHLTNTLRQGLILEALDFPMPQYAHASLILGEDRSKLSKRHGATSVDQFKQQGLLKEAMINYLAALGWNDGTDKEIYTVGEIVEGFDVERVNSSPSMFDMTKLKWVNGQHIRGMDPAAIAPMVKELLSGSDLLQAADEVEDRFVDLAVANTQDKIEVLTESVGLVEEVLGFQFDETAASKQGAAIVEDEFGELAAAIVAAYDAGEMPTGAEGDAEAFEAAWKDWVKALGKGLGRKGKRLFMPIRLAVTGTMSGGDIGTQLRLVAAADGVVAPEKVVPLAQRIEKLRSL